MHFLQVHAHGLWVLYKAWLIRPWQLVITSAVPLHGAPNFQACILCCPALAEPLAPAHSAMLQAMPALPRLDGGLRPRARGVLCTGATSALRLFGVVRIAWVS